MGCENQGKLPGTAELSIRLGEVGGADHHMAAIASDCWKPPAANKVENNPGFAQWEIMSSQAGWEGIPRIDFTKLDFRKLYAALKESW